MKKIILIASLLCFIGLGSFIYMGGFSSNEINMEKASIEVVTSSVNLLSAFEADETRANERYASKVVKVSGSLSDVKTINESQLQLVLKADNSMGNVVCNLQSKDRVDLDKLKIGDVINVKGLCTGYMFDVVMDQCIVIN